MRAAGIVLSALGISLLLGFGACRSTELHNTITMIPRNTAQAFSVTEHAGAAEAARKLHVNLYWNGPSSDSNVEQQIALMGRSIDMGSMGIIVNPNSTFALNTIIQRALSSGIPVVILGANIPLRPSRNLSFVLDDVAGTGDLIATRLKTILNSEGDAALLGVDPMYAGSIERAMAIESSLERAAPSIRIVDEPAGAFSFGQTEQDAEEMIRRHPGMSAIVGLNVMATSAAVAAVRATRSVGHVRIIGCDQGLDLFFLLRHGVLDSIVVQNMRAMGALAVAKVVVQRRGGRVENATHFPAMLVTRSNIDDAKVQEMLMMDWRSKP